MTDLTIPEALDKLASEGDADQIAAHLHRLGIRTGSRVWGGSTCPVSRYLLAHGHAVSVGYDVWVRFDGANPDCHGDLPVSVSNFVERMDDGGYPELIGDGS